jgi:glutamate racemase
VARQTKTVWAESVGLRDDTKKRKAVFYSNSNPKVLSEILNNQYTIKNKDF